MSLQISPPAVKDLFRGTNVQSLSSRMPAFLRNAAAQGEAGEGWGLLCYAASAFCNSMMMITVKLGQQAGFSTWELLMARSLYLAVVCVIQLSRSQSDYLGLKERRPLLLLRGALGCTAVTTLFFATKNLPIADATVFSFLAPVIVAVLSPYILKESSQGVWISILGCSIGVMLVAQPGFLFGTARLSVLGVCLGITQATASGTAKICVRALKEEVTHVKMLYLAACSVLLSGTAMLFSPWGFSIPSWYGSLLLASCGIWGYGVQVFMTLGLERARAAKALTMVYTSIVWTEFAGIFVFKEVPNAWAVVGVVVIIGATYYSSQPASIKRGPSLVASPGISVSGTPLGDLLPDEVYRADSDEIIQLARSGSLSPRNSTISQ